MAYTIREMYPPGLNPWSWYNVSFSVGQNGTNRVDDVYLVQLLLSYLRPYVLVLQDPSLKLLAVDGSCGPITQSYIEAYQSHVQAGFASYRPDGLVDPGFRYGITVAGTPRMIVSLNRELYEKARAAHEGVPTDARTPAILRMALARVL